MAGTMNGFSPRDFNSSTVAFVIRAMLATPRLPDVMATVCPGFTFSRRRSPRMVSRTAPGMSANIGPSNSCFTRNIFGNSIMNLLLFGPIASTRHVVAEPKHTGEFRDHPAAHVVHDDPAFEHRFHGDHDLWLFSTGADYVEAGEVDRHVESKPVKRHPT